MLRRENQKRGHFPLDEYSLKKVQPMTTQKFVSRLYVGANASAKKEVVLENEIEAVDASDATAQSKRDRREDALRLVPDLDAKMFDRSALWISDPK